MKFKGCAHAEYLTIPAHGRVPPLSKTLSIGEGASCSFGGQMVAEFLIDRARLCPDERLLAAGATGSVGGAAVQIGRHLGAGVVARSCPKKS